MLVNLPVFPHNVKLFIIAQLAQPLQQAAGSISCSFALVPSRRRSPVPNHQGQSIVLPRQGKGYALLGAWPVLLLLYPQGQLFSLLQLARGGGEWRYLSITHATTWQKEMGSDIRLSQPEGQLTYDP